LVLLLATITLHLAFYTRNIDLFFILVSRKKKQFKEKQLLCCILEPEILTKWPKGKYSIPSSLFGCPEEGWDIGYISLTVDDNYFYWTSNFGDIVLTVSEQIEVDGENKEMHIFGHYSNTTLLLNFCTRNDVISEHSFQGNFCTFKVGTGCSLGMFTHVI
jgi:hypothetical protein